jgi:hypothetical protein
MVRAMKTSGWILGVLVAAGVVVTIKGGCLSSSSGEPDARLAGHFKKIMCDIGGKNIKTPAKGVRELGRYLDKHVGDILGDFGDTIAAIERIKDDDKHDRRAEKARDRLVAPIVACARDWRRFEDAIESDPESIELLTEFNERLGRTLEIILGDAARDFDLLELPRRLEASVR